MASMTSINSWRSLSQVGSGLPVTRAQFSDGSSTAAVAGHFDEKPTRQQRAASDGSGYQVTSNVATVLNLHHHERHIVTLRLAICKVGHFSEDAFNDFARRHSAAGPQQALELFHPPELAGSIGRLGDSVGVCHQNVFLYQLELCCRELSFWIHANRQSFCAQMEQFAALRSGPHDDRRIVAGIDILQQPARGLVLCVEK